MVLDGGNETIFHSEPSGMMEHVCGLLDFFSSVSNSISFLDRQPSDPAIGTMVIPVRKEFKVNIV